MIEASYAQACRHCDAGHAPTWQAHTREWVHINSPLAAKGSSWSITICAANHLRKRKPPNAEVKTP
jgi:hypothetical protein